MTNNMDIAKMKKKASVLRKIALLANNMQDNADKFLFLPVFLIIIIVFLNIGLHNELAEKYLIVIVIAFVAFVMYWVSVLIMQIYTNRWFKKFNKLYISYTLQRNKEM